MSILGYDLNYVEYRVLEYKFLKSEIWLASIQKNTEIVPGTCVHVDKIVVRTAYMHIRV